MNQKKKIKFTFYELNTFFQKKIKKIVIKKGKITVKQFLIKNCKARESILKNLLLFLLLNLKKLGR